MKYIVMPILGVFAWIILMWISGMSVVLSLIWDPKNACKRISLFWMGWKSLFDPSFWFDAGDSHNNYLL